MENILPPADETLARQPDAKAIAAAIADDAVINNVHARWLAKEKARTAEDRAEISKEKKLLAKLRIEAGKLKSQIKMKQMRIASLKSKSRIRALPASKRAQLSERRRKIKLTQLRKFLRTKRIEFASKTKGL